VKRRRLITVLGTVWLGLGLLLALSLWSLGNNGAEGARQRLDERQDNFRRAYLEARQALDAEQMMALYFLEGVTAEERRLLRLALEFEIDLPVRGFSFQPLRSGSQLAALYDRDLQVLTIDPVGIVEVVYETEDRFTNVYLLGLHEGSYRIAYARRVE
jgi:hypothetical protein